MQWPGLLSYICTEKQIWLSQPSQQPSSLLQLPDVVEKLLIVIDRQFLQVGHMFHACLAGP